MGYTSGSPLSLSGTQTLRSLDGTGLSLTVQDTELQSSGFAIRQLNSATAYDASGIVYSGSPIMAQASELPSSWWGTRTDSNGNIITSNGTSYTDTMGRVVPVPPISGGYSTPTSNTDQSGCTGSRPITAAVVWNVPGYNGYNGGTYPIKFCYASLTIDVYNDGASPPNEGTTDGVSGIYSVLQSLVLPDPNSSTFSQNTTAWEFEYNDQDSGGQYGSLTKITLPTGGSISYSYATIGVGNGSLSLLQRAVVSRTVSDGVNSNTWNYSYTFQTANHTSTTVQEPVQPYDPPGQTNVSVHSLQALTGDWSSGFETQVNYYQGSSSGTLLKTVSKAFNTYLNPYYQVPGLGVGFGPGKAGMIPSSTTTTLPPQVSEVAYTYDSGFTVYDNSGNVWSPNIPYGLQTSVSSYDYGSGAPGSLLKTDTTAYLWQSNLNYLNANLLNLKSKVATYNGNVNPGGPLGTEVAETDYTYDNASLLTASGISTQHGSSPTGIRGNQSTIAKVLIGGGSNPTTTLNYYDTGELHQSTDPMGNATTYIYSTTYAGAYPTQTQLPNTCSPNCVSHSVSGAYDFNTGVLTSYTDQNSKTTTVGYDAARRITSGVFPAGGGQKTFSYTDTVGALQVVAQTQQTSSTWLQKTIKFDGLGRKIQSIIADPEDNDSSETVYDATGHVYQVTNPHRTSSSTTDGLVQNKYDGLGRGILITEQDQGKVTTLYTGNCTTVTDEANTARMTCKDALGRMTQVYEDPNGRNYLTNYLYDALGNLTCSEQHGGVSGTGCSSSSSNDSTSAWRVRRFTYDSLSRLLTAKNPETGTVQYTYNAASDLTSKTDARGVTINYSPSTNPIDALHRVIQKTYSTGDPSVTYSYDSTASSNYGIGLRTGMTDASGSTNWIFDQMGRPITESDIIGGVQATINTSFNLDSSISAITYPTGSVIAYSYDTAGHVIAVNDKVNNLSYAQGGWYTPPGMLAYASFGSSQRTDLYDARLQPCWLYVTTGTPLAPNTTPCSSSATAGTLLDMKYNYGFGSNDNGDLFGITNNVNTNLSKSFTYDTLNRIQQYQTTNSTLFGVAYTIDPWGNLTNKSMLSGYGGELLAAPANLQNQLTGFTYDAGGNMTNDGRYTYAFNGENQISSANGVTFLYDGDGERVQKSDGTTYWGGGSSGALVESDNSGNPKAEYIFFDGKRIARRDLPSGNVRYYFGDHLGSASVIADPSGNMLEQYDYAPFGELHWTNGSDTNHYLFTGKERDSETGLDYFGARYYENNIGRWLSPDWAAKPAAVPYANYGNPQSLNLYAYVVNRPTTTADPDGHEPPPVQPAPQCQSSCSDLPVSKKDANMNGNDTQGANSANAKVQLTLDGNLHTTHNADGTTSSYQGTTSTTTTTDSKGNVVSTTTTTSVTTQTLNEHGDIVQTTTKNTSTTVDANGKVTGTSSSVVGVQANSEQAQSMRSGSITLWQMKLPDLMPKVWGPKILEHFNVTPADIMDGLGSGRSLPGCSSIFCN